MYSFYRSHPRLAALLILIVSMLLAFADCLPRLHNDDIQEYFLICNGGVGETTPFGLYNNVVFGSLVQSLVEWLPAINGYLALMLVVICVSLFIVNEFVLSWRGRQAVGAFSVVADVAGLLFLCYFNILCLSDLYVQYTHAAILAGVAASFVLFSALMGQAGWKRIITGLFLFFSMYVLRPECIMSFVFLSGGVVLAWLSIQGWRKVPKAAGAMVVGMVAVFVTCVVAEAWAYSNSPEWNDALTYRKLRVHIQDYPDNSGKDKSAELTAAGIDPAKFAIYKSFTYVPDLDDVDLISTAREIHVKDNKGLFGSELAARVGLLEPEKKKMIEPFTDLVILTPWFPLVACVGLFILTLQMKSARAVFPILLATSAYVFVLLLSGRCTERVLDPALFYATAWVLAFLPAESYMGRFRILRWGSLAGVLLCFAVCMRHYRIHLVSPVQKTAADVCQATPGNLYLSTTLQASPLFRSGLVGFNRDYFRSTNIVPISDGWIFYTPAYRDFLKARGIDNPYLLAANDNVYFVVKDAAQGTPRILEYVDAMYSMYTGGKHLTFSKVAQDRAISFWKAQVAPANTAEPGS